MNEKETSKNVWIIKPGENSNRGTGIEVSKDLADIENLITLCTSTSTSK